VEARGDRLNRRMGLRELPDSMELEGAPWSSRVYFSDVFLGFTMVRTEVKVRDGEFRNRAALACSSIHDAVGASRVGVLYGAPSAIRNGPYDMRSIRGRPSLHRMCSFFIMVARCGD
jgi:hypothetical protein